MKISLKATRLGLRNSTTRIPFRYGNACLTRCPQAVLAATVEVAGKRQVGYSGECLPPSWFDKSADKDFAQQIDDMLAAIDLATLSFRDVLARPSRFFPAWLAANQQVQDLGGQRDMTPLLSSFGFSMLERAVLDAICRAHDVSFADAVRSNLFGIEPGAVHQELVGCQPRQWLPARPADSIYVRHTIGLGDPLTAADVPPEERIDDGFPHLLEQYVQRCGLRYFKVKVSNQLEHDLDRIAQIAALVERHRGDDYRITLDGNEQYKQAEQFDRLIAAIRAERPLNQFWENVLAIEQPLDRKIALSSEHTQGIRELSQLKPVIIDESDGTLDAYRQAIALGYRGVSSKCCKGAIKSLLNAGLTWWHNDRGQRSDYLMTGEDLCSVGIVPVQADMCLVATLGLRHIERNGHHYHPGLSYLPKSQQQAALVAHGDFYHEYQGVIAPKLVEGRFEIGSLQCAGFGFAVEPEMESMQSPAAWDFGSLGLNGE